MPTSRKYLCLRTLLLVIGVSLVVTDRYAISAETPVPTIRVIGQRCEYLTDPLGIDVMQPRLSWKIEAVDLSTRGQEQTAYQLLVAGSEELLRTDRGDLWDSGKVESDQTTFVKYAGKSFRSKMQCWWKVRCWDKDGQVSGWSQPGRWTMGLLDKAAWGGAKWIWSGPDWRVRWADYWQPVLGETERPITRAHWICCDLKADSDDKGKPAHRHFRHEIQIPAGKKITRAIAEMNTDGHLWLSINGRQVLSEGHYQVQAAGVSQIDVAEHLRPGSNTLAVRVNKGRGRAVNLAGTLWIEFSDGPPLVVTTDEKWQFVSHR